MASRSFLSKLDSTMAGLGWSRLPLRRKHAIACFYKLMGNALVLTLAVEESSRDGKKFTGSFYLSKSFAWSYCVGDFPRDAYARIGHFLEKDERDALLSAEYRGDGIVDAWWHDYEEVGLDSFCRAVALAEPRFLAQDGLQSKIDQSRVVQEQAALTSAIRSLVRAGEGEGVVPERVKIEEVVPMEWYSAATQLLSREAPEWSNPDGIKLMAEDAWCLETLAIA